MHNTRRTVAALVALLAIMAVIAGGLRLATSNAPTRRSECTVTVIGRLDGQPDDSFNTPTYADADGAASLLARHAERVEIACAAGTPMPHA